MTTSTNEHNIAELPFQQLSKQSQEDVIAPSALEKVIVSALSSNVFSSVNAKFTSPHTMEANNVLNVDCVEVPLSYNDFYEKFMFNNVPCLLGSWVTSNWLSCKSWTKELGGNLVPDFDLLLESCCSATVPVADCKSREFNAQEKSDWTFGDYIDYLDKHSSNDHPTTEACLYLKDWHYFRDFPNHDAYTVPLYFSSDWLFELWRNCLPPFDDDYRFVYIGPKHSWTPFHADVFHSYSWSANICGRKKWLLFPPGSEECLKDQNGRLPYDVTTSSSYTSMPHVEVTQEAGQVLFVPAGWHHQVQNVEDTISINHNWINGCTIGRVWDFLQAELSDVEREISDCHESMDSNEWTSHCQLIMLSHTGIDYMGFFQIVRNISSRRIAIITKGVEAARSDIDFKLCDKAALIASYDAQHCATILSLLKSVCYRLPSKGMNRNLHSVLEPLSDLCFIIPVLLGMTDTFRGMAMTMTSAASDCSSLLREICFCLDDVVFVFSNIDWSEAGSHPPNDTS